MESRICSEVNRDINLYFVCTVASLQHVSGFDSNSGLFMWSLDRFVSPAFVGTFVKSNSFLIA